MKCHNRLLVIRIWMAAWLCLLVATGQAHADAPQRARGDWQSSLEEKTGITTSSMELVLHTAPEPKPALKYRLMPDDFDRRDHNAALYYLKAMGFLEENAARKGLTKLHEQALEKAHREGKSLDESPPFSYDSTHPDEYPIGTVREYLSHYSFQPPLLEEASLCRQFRLDRNIREIKSPFAYLVPEIQTMRDLARTQRVRTRLAIAEDRVDDAVRIVGQQLALGNHLGQDDFFVSYFCGVASSNIALTDLCFLVQRPKTPNLYWALATLPNPLVNMEKSLSFERQFLFLQLKPLAYVDAMPKPAEYWNQIIDQNMPQIRDLLYDWKLPEDPIAAKMWVAMQIATAFPSARDYLLHQHGMTDVDLAKLCVTQTVLLGFRLCYEELRDEAFKNAALPAHLPHQAIDESELGKVYGWVAAPANVVLGGYNSTRQAQVRQQQLIGLIQTVESIRQYGANHAGRLPPDLSALKLPAPWDPATKSPFEYRLTGDKAVLSSHAYGNIRHQLVIQFRN